MFEKWIATDFTSLSGVAVSTLIVYLAIIGYCRFTGLRSFSKMSASDFAMTVAVGSLFASTIANPAPSLILGLFALALLFAGQGLIAFVRRKFDGASQIVDNQPLLLMRGPDMIEANMERANVTRCDIIAKLREANVHNFNQIRAVVFEATGDISVLHGTDGDLPDFDEDILLDVISGASDS